MKTILTLLIAGTIVAGLAAQQSPQAFAGKWQMAVGAPQATVFNRTLDITASGTTLTGVMTIGTRTVKLAGEVKDGSMTLRPEPAPAATSDGDELDAISGLFRDGEIQGTYSHHVHGRAAITGWRAKRPE
jgi:hypothetical protein